MQQETEKHLKDLDSDQKDQFVALRQENQSLLSEVSTLQTTLDELNTEALKLEEELNSDGMKQKALQLHDELHQLQKQKADLEEETGQTQLSIPEEIERLTQKVFNSLSYLI
jgi:hypothetical protein